MRISALRVRAWLVEVLRAFRIYTATPGRTLIAVMALALGVGLGLAVHLVNRAALAEFGSGLRAVSGGADLTVRGPRTGFPTDVYAAIAVRPDVEIASPMLELEVRVIGQQSVMTVLGIDVFRAGRLQPSLIPMPSDGDPRQILDPTSVYVSPALVAKFNWRDGSKFLVQVGTDVVDMVVRGRLPPDIRRPALAVMDIAGAQALAGNTANINRVDIRLRPGADRAAAATAIAAALPSGVVVETGENIGAAEARLSRAYRVNLTVLALVALFTGALLVYSTQTLTVMRRRTEIALLRALGLTRAEVLSRLIGESAMLGVVGAALGILLGYGLAALVLAFFGADLGAGFFTGMRPQVSFSPWATIIFFTLGVIAAMCGAVLPGIEASAAAPARALRSGDEDAAWAKVRSAWPGGALLAVAAVTALIPPVDGLPIGGYLAVACLLLGVITLMPRVAQITAAWLPTFKDAAFNLAGAQLRGSPGQAAMSLGAIVAAVSLAVSMSIMVSSFRSSVDAWLTKLLPADLYVRSGGGSDSAFFSARDQSALMALPGIARGEFLRADEIVLDKDRPRAMLLARDIDPADAQARLPLVRQGAVPAAAIPVWISEAIAETYGHGLGTRFDIPIAGLLVTVTVAGIWRDYGRQQGAIVMERKRFIALTGDERANDAGIWLLPNIDVATLRSRLQLLAPGGNITTPGELRTRSLAVFDRTFAVTYALEAAAVLIGLAGLAASFSGVVLARRREFGVLRHVGFRRSDIARMLALQGGAVATLAAIVGLIAGGIMSLILVHVINRQAFGWTMDLQVPWLTLALFCGVIVGLAIITAVASGRAAMANDAVRMVKEDW